VLPSPPPPPPLLPLPLLPPLLLLLLLLPGEGDLKQLLLGKGVSLSSQFRLTYSMMLNLLRVEDLKVNLCYIVTFCCYILSGGSDGLVWLTLINDWITKNMRSTWHLK
jgi:hypothetical protein